MENVVQDTIGHEQYGTFAALYALGFLFMTLADLGMNMFTTKKVAGEPDKLHETFSIVLFLKLLLGLLYPLLMALLGFLLQYSREEIWLLVLISFTHSILLLLHFVRSNFQGKQAFRLDTVVSVSDKIILVVMLLVLLGTGLTLKTYVYTRLVSAALTLVIFYLVFIKLYGFVKPAFTYRGAREILSYSVPFAIMTILFSVNEKIDQVMLERMGDAVTGKLRSGLYAGAYRWLDAFQMYLWTILPYFFARFAYYRNDTRRLQQVFNMGQILAAIPMIIVSVFVFFYAEKLFWLFGNSSQQEINLMANTSRILFLTCLVNGFSGIYGSLLTSCGYENKLSRIVIISIVINVVLNYIFIPKYATYAAAANTFISGLLIASTSVWFVHKGGHVKVPFDILFRLLLFALLLALSFYLLQKFLLSWIVITIIAGLLTLPFFYMLGLARFVHFKTEK